MGKYTISRSSVSNTTRPVKLPFLNIKMTTRAFSNLSNLPAIQPVNRRITRATKRVLHSNDQLHKKPRLGTFLNGKENYIVNSCNNVKDERQTKIALKRLNNKIQEEEGLMEKDVVDDKRVIPYGVKDIDAENALNVQLCSEYALETYAYLKQIERRGTVKANYLSGCPVTDKMRAVLVDWLVEVQIQFKLLQETLFMTIDTIDRFLAVEGKCIYKSRLQLVGVAAMFLMAKVEEVYAPEVSDFVYITDNTYTGEEIRDMELRIVKALNFWLHQPVSIGFLRRYSKAGDVDVLQHSLAKYILELSLYEYNLVPISGSLVAASSLCLSLLLLDNSSSMNTVWTPTLQFYSGYSAKVVLAVVRKLATLLVRLNRICKLEAVRNKFKSAKLMKVADLVVLKGEKLLKLADNCE